ncbi:MAG: ATP-dependent protease [Planctomycetaceae bacterium]|nr:MAG: ATP-dependent protease [Planctomycetaceae bacterium]
MEPLSPLPASELSWICDPDQLPFETTDDLDDLKEFLGQARALNAVRFGISIRRDGYNLYVLGPPGVGKRTIVQSFLEQKATNDPRPCDWCYVQNFEEPHKPHALRFPPGRGAKFVADMENLVEDLRISIPAALETEEHKTQVQQIEQETREFQNRAFQELTDRAQTQGIQVIRTHAGFALAPSRDGKVLEPERYDQLSEAERSEIQGKIERLQEELHALVAKLPRWRREARERIKQANQDAARFALEHLMNPLQEQYSDLDDVVRYLRDVEEDVIANTDEFQSSDENPEMPFLSLRRQRSALDEYQVNLIVDHEPSQGAPVVYEEHPSFQNLLGRIEHQSHMGTLETHFTLIKPGSIHRANGGYLVVEALRLFRQPYAWEGLKRCLYARHVKIESLAESLGLISTVSLEPEPIPLDVKVVLLGDRMLYYLLHQYDRDFAELFKVAADFEEKMDRSDDSCLLYAQLIATLVRREQHRRFDRTAVARILEHSARVAADSEKLTTHMRTITDLIREADYWCASDGHETVTVQHVDQAIDQQIHRADRVRDQVQEQIVRGTLLIDTHGSQVGQVNGLSVLDLGNFSFGRPSRITATVRLGKGDVVDIEREVELGGPIHSKGVLILGSLLAARYAQDHPLSLSASVVFEQSYGMVDGDSASVAEFCALLSALSIIPVRQSLAVTGSVNQHGQVQAIGGVNEKIEGFYDICQRRGLTGDQGVLIPAANVPHLMLRRDVIAAVRQGRFHVYPITDVNQAVALLTGVSAGDPDENGHFLEGTVNHAVTERLRKMFQLRQQSMLPLPAIVNTENP